MIDLIPGTTRRATVRLAVSFVALVLVGLSAAAAANWAARSGLGNLVVIPIGGITAIALLFLFLGGYRLLGARRDKAVAQRFSSAEGVVFSSGRTRDFRMAVARYRVGDPATAIPYDFTVVCSSDGVSFWTGPVVDPASFAKMPWYCVSGVTVDDVKIDQRRSRGLVLETVDGGRLELQPLGQGFLATFPFSTEALLRVSERLNAFVSTANSTTRDPQSSGTDTSCGKDSPLRNETGGRNR